ncbi:MAG TPA: DinB family protein [bacterium]|mgnify:CR=1 FL=1|nr:DinB family protein [bacterium]HQG46039.1 DinB family protein [bacterium]HQI47463.1 DinB family protein [bacterium]HQJ65302.1 DinB family protein [bacterium]
MNWKELITSELEDAYKVSAGLFDLVEEKDLNWKPATGSNWMTIAQLLKHIADCCAGSFKGILTGDWGMPEGVDINSLPPEEMLPPAEILPAVGSVAEARKLLNEDRAGALRYLDTVSEEQLATTAATVPWDPSEMLLGHRLLQMVEHMKQHKGQLYYYLKLQGKPVHTGHLYGM